MQKSGGHVVGTSAGPKWRCPVCTFVSSMERTSCSRCREPVEDEEERKKLMVKAGPKQGNTMVRAPLSTANRSKTAVGTSSPKHSAVARRSSSTSNSNNSSAPRRSSTSTSASSSSSKPKAKAAKVHTIPKKAASKVTSRPADNFHKGDLGYKAKKNNVHTAVQSRLNHDTASYRAKFEKEDEQKKGPGSNIHTVGSTMRNGFVSSARTKSSGNSHDEKPAPRPAKYHGFKGGSGTVGGGKSTHAVDKAGGLLGYLQAAATTGAVASHKHKGVTTHAPKVVANEDGTHTKLAL